MGVVTYALGVAVTGLVRVTTGEVLLEQVHKLSHPTSGWICSSTCYIFPYDGVGEYVSKVSDGVGGYVYKVNDCLCF